METAQRNVRRLFERAAQSAPAIVFLDEPDALGYDRGHARHGWEVGPLNQLLAALDGFRPLRGVAVLAATNRPERLDPALVRPGRFDRVVEIPPPSQEGRQAILTIHTAGMPLTADVSLEHLAAETPGFTGAELRALGQDAVLAAWRRAGDAPLDDLHVHGRDFEQAVRSRRPWGCQNPDNPIPPSAPGRNRVPGALGSRRVGARPCTSSASSSRGRARMELETRARFAGLLGTDCDLRPEGTAFQAAGRAPCRAVVRVPWPPGCGRFPAP